MTTANHKLADALRVSACELYLMYRFDFLRGSVTYSACGLLFVCMECSKGCLHWSC